MAKWKDLSKYINNNYEIKEEKEGFISMVIDLGNLRSQMVFIQSVRESEDSNWIEILSPIGDIPLERINEVLTKIEDKLCGGLVRIGEKHYIRHNMPIDDLSIKEFTQPLRIVTNIADQFEDEYVGDDSN